MEFKIQPVPATERRPKPTDENKLGFGKIYSDHMFTATWSPNGGWAQGTVKKYGALDLAPAALVLHYGQTIFEGLKAYRNQHGTINLFRPLKNLERFNRSAARLDLPQVPEELFMGAIEALLELDHEWIPHSHGTSLYIRPTMIGAEPYIGLKSASEVLLFFITGPVGAYYPEGFNPVKITVCEAYSRAGPGGLGSAKTAANYAASLLAEKEAIKRGFTQVLWLDAAERKYVEEVGSMNILFKIKGKVVSPPPGETILAGITRDSALQLLRSWDVPVEEYRITIDEVLQAHADGTLEEVFGAGTAAVISPVGLLEYKGHNYEVADGQTGPVARKLFDELMGIQYGLRPDPFQWIHEVVPTTLKANVASQPVAATRS
ncbi:MAG TPA: branched-chain amino acid aminotransferase [bacterium]|nr:branched-chain amino acid aminotransferase [bacterium]